MQKNKAGLFVFVLPCPAGTGASLKIRLASFLLFFAVLSSAFAESAASVIKKAVARSGEEGVSLSEVLVQVEQAAAAAQSDSDRRSLYSFLGSLTESAGLYEEASKWYALAAGIAAAPAAGTQAMTSEQLVLAAVRSALCGGVYQTAESYLPSIRSSKNQETLAFARLYTVWAWLCRSETQDDMAEPYALLESYATMESMEPVRPAVYLTLWYLTQDDNWSGRLLSEYPTSPEMSIVSGDASIYPSPFWYFLPKEQSLAELPASGTTSEPNKAASSKSTKEDSAAAASGEKNKILCHQLGFFRNSENAGNLMERVRSAGFSPMLSEEKRSSGTVYYVVTVPDDGSDTMGLRLKTAGFESYPVFAE